MRFKSIGGADTGQVKCIYIIYGLGHNKFDVENTEEKIMAENNLAGIKCGSELSLRVPVPVPVQ